MVNVDELPYMDGMGSSSGLSDAEIGEQFSNRSHNS